MVVSSIVRINCNAVIINQCEQGERYPRESEEGSEEGVKFIFLNHPYP
jgi:hypothetical protein